MYLFGDDFAYMNAYACFKNLESAIKAANKYGEGMNMTFVMSTPGRYVDALKKENVTWPVQYDDFMNYYEKKEMNSGSAFEFWSGYYTSRPDFKKHIKDSSA